MLSALVHAGGGCDDGRQWRDIYWQFVLDRLALRRRKVLAREEGAQGWVIKGFAAELPGPRMGVVILYARRESITLRYSDRSVSLHRRRAEPGTNALCTGDGCCATPASSRTRSETESPK